jgi:hypothetical protein
MIRPSGYDADVAWTSRDVGQLTVDLALQVQGVAPGDGEFLGHQSAVTADCVQTYIVEQIRRARWSAAS